MGLELRAIQSPIFSEPFDFTFHVQAFTLLVGSSGWKIKPLSNDCPS